MNENDEYGKMEILDTSTYDFAKEATERFNEHFGKASAEIMERLRKFADIPVTLQVRVNSDHFARLYKEEGWYRIVVDGRQLASTMKLITWFSVSDDFARVAYFETDGSDEGTLYILKDGNIVERHEGFFNQVIFLKDGYYAVQSFRGENRPEGVPLNAQRVMLNGKIAWGKDVSEDEFISISGFRDECLVSVGNWMKARIYRGKIEDPITWKQVLNLDHPADPIAIRGNDVYVLEFSGFGAISRNGEIILKFDNPIEEFSGSIEPVMILGDEIIAFTLQDAKLLPVVYDLSGRKKTELPVYAFSALTASSKDEKKCIFYSTSLGKPEIVYSYSSGRLEKVSENTILDPEIKEGFAMNGETRVHYFLASAKGSRHDRAVVYGYGGFNVSTTPGYRHIYAYLLEQGIDIVICNLRGGNEYGEEWHLHGTRENKINVFNDFKAVLTTMRSRGYRIVVDGASNGGLLTSYSLINFPELLDGAVIGKPVIDMMRFHLLLAGNYWVNEYGNPDDENDRKFLSEYSPYNHVRKRVYPPSLTWVRMNDDRVHPAHGLKFYARLQATGSQAYLRADFTGGHIGLKHESMLQESADVISFVQSCLKPEPHERDKI